MFLLHAFHGLCLGAQQGDQGGLTGRALNHAATLSTAAGKKFLWQVNHLAQPVQHDHLQFGARGTGDPCESNAGDGTAQHVSHDGRIGIGRWEVGVEARTVPMSDSRHDDPLHVGHNVLPVLGRLWGCIGDEWAQIAGLDLGENAPGRFKFLIVR